MPIFGRLFGFIKVFIKDLRRLAVFEVYSIINKISTVRTVITL